MSDRIRVLIAKIGLDGHDTGARTVARGLVEAGMEVIYTGIRQTPDNIVHTAIQEDVDVIGVSILSGAHMHYLPRIMNLLREAGDEGRLVIAGGVIPDDDALALQRVGISRVFNADSQVADIAAYIRAEASANRA